jgi:hypothetical protein
MKKPGRGLLHCSLSVSGGSLHRLYLTFDTEDSISENSVWVLRRILESLRRHDLEGLFFITGHMAERLGSFPAIVDSLREHQIGYHSSGHSVHPTIFEFTDVENYEQAYKNSLQRETSHINPLNGEIEGEGGILTLRKLFPGKEIRAFRAPGHCWTPPHTEAMRTLGLTFDFSTSLSSAPAKFKGITFYPRSSLGHWEGRVSEYCVLSLSLARKELTVVSVHPSLLVNKDEWDAIYWPVNPPQIVPPQPRSLDETNQLLRNFDLLLRRIEKLRKLYLVEPSPILKETSKGLMFTRSDVEQCYQQSMRWATRYKYKPKFAFDHFVRFFKTNKYE